MKRIWLSLSLLAVILIGSKVDASLFSYYEEQGLRLPSVSLRAKDAKDCGILGYKGLKEQNLRLERCLGRKYAQVLSYAPTGVEDVILGGVTPRRPTEFKTFLNEQKTEGHSDTTIKVTSVQTKDLNYIDGTLLGDAIVLSINPGASNAENVKCTGVTTSTMTFTGCVFGFRFDDPLTTQSSNIKAHSPGETVIISNTDTYLALQYFTLDGNHIITGTSSWQGVQTFTVFPEVFGSMTPTNSDQFATKRYADNLANVGSATATQAAVGLVLLANPTQMASSTFIDANNPHVLYSRYSTSSCEFATSSAIISKRNGRISKDCLDLSEQYTFTGEVTSTAGFLFTGNVTTTNVTGTGSLYITASTTILGQTNLHNVSTTDITINGLDGNTLATNSTTNAVDYHFHSAQCSTGQETRAVGSTGIQTVTTSLGVAPSYVLIQAANVCVTTAELCSSYGTWEAANTHNGNVARQSSTYWNASNSAAPIGGQNTTNILDLRSSGAASVVVANLSATDTETFTLNFTTNGAGGQIRRWQWTACK